MTLFWFILNLGKIDQVVFFSVSVDRNLYYRESKLIVKTILPAFCGSITELNGDISLMTILC